jgi:aspartyl-tRNA(Asn)/glutamyl-tRNA(Gln) amidotransferase subunit B
MLRLLTEQGRGVGETRITPGSLAGLIRLIDAGTINSNTAKTVFTILFNDGGDPDSIVREKGLAQVSDTGAIAVIVDEVIAENAKSASDFKAGKRAALQFLVGQVMRKSKGKANPQLAQQMLETRMA